MGESNSTSPSWNKQEWIKNVLLKSGTDILEIKDDKKTVRETINKMVYYPALPLIVKSNDSKEQQLCQQLAEPSTGHAYHHQSSINAQQHQRLDSSHHQQMTNSVSSHNCFPHGNVPADQHHLHVEVTPISPSQNHITAPQSNFPVKSQFKCDQCNMTFGSKSAQTSHMKSHASAAVSQNGYGHQQSPPNMSGVGLPAGLPVGSDPYQCNVCKKTFAVPARLIRHYRTHTGERPFECEFCHKMFSVKENLQVHRRIHTKERPYKCDVCGRAFEHSGKLHRHMRIHTGERPHKCSVCNKTFIQSGQLVIHMRTHTGEKPYKCPVEGCGKGFTCSKQLKVHSRTHTGEKPYHCDICFRDFGYNHVLKLHRVQHYGSKCYKCTICDETFKSKKEMEAHIKGHANEMPDDDDEQAQQKSQQQQQSHYSQQQLSPRSDTTPVRYTREPIPELEKSRDSIATVSTISSVGNTILETPRASSSEPNSDIGEDMVYYTSSSNGYSQFEQSQPAENGLDFSIHRSSSSTSTINPALLAAASIASRRIEETNCQRKKYPPVLLNIKTEPELIRPAISEFDQSDVINPHSSPPSQRSPTVNSFVYEPLAVMRQHGYFGPAPVAEYRPSLCGANEIVRRVEAAIAGAEPLLTPPRSSTESPDRSSSPESDSAMMMADRDVMTLPLRKRKLYMNDNQSKDVSPTSSVRISSVIQFANKAS